VGEDKHHIGEAQGEVGERIHPGHPAAGVDENRNLCGLSHPPDRLRRPVAEAERLRSRMQLDPARAEREAPLRLPHRVLSRIQTAVRVQPSARLRRPPQDAIIGHPIRRLAIGIMQSKRASSRVGSDLVQTRDQRRQVLLLPVLVSAQVRVRVHDDSVSGQQITNLSHERPIGGGGIHERILAR
jgi:hypothetical protein